MTSDDMKTDRINNIIQLPVPRGTERYPIDAPTNAALFEKVSKANEAGYLDDIVNIIQQVEKTFEEYKSDSLRYKICFSAPARLIRDIEEKFKKNEYTEGLLPYLYKSWKINLSSAIYTGTVLFTIFCGGFFFVSVISAILGFFWLLLMSLTFLIILWAWVFFVQIPVFDDTIKAIVFTDIYNTICDVIESLHKKSLNFLADTALIPLSKEQLEQDADFQKFKNNLDSGVKENYEILELKRRTCTHQLAHTLTLNQASTERDRQIISAEARLDYMGKKQEILEIAKEKERVHEIAYSIAENMGQALVEQAKVLARDSEEWQKIDYQLAMINGIKGEIQKNGYAAMSNPSVTDSIRKMMEMAMTPKKTK
jgi:hypothetical protein